MAYSAKVSGLLKSIKASEGDRLRVDKAGVVFEGVLLPKADEGSVDSLVLKLDSGYNVGVLVDEKTKVQRFDSPKKEVGKPKETELKQKKGLSKIVLIATGGTITSKADYEKGGVKTMLSPKELISQFPQLLDAAEVVAIETPFPAVMSEDFDSSHWMEIARTARNALSKADGVIVTQGTDSLGYTAAAVAFMLGSVNKPVLFTAAQRSADRGSFDGSLNLACCARFVSSGFKGVAVVMHGSSSDDFCLVHKATKVRKMHSSRRDAFRSVNDKPLAKVWSDGRVEKMQEFVEYGGSGFIGFDERVALVKAHPMADPGVFDYYAKNGVRGIIIEGMGLGHVPTHSKKSWISFVKRLVDSGVFVGVATQTVYGRVNPKVYAHLRELESAGAVFLKDMLAETALMKLGWVLAQSKKRDEVERKMLEPVAGEFNDRLTDDEFMN